MSIAFAQRLLGAALKPVLVFSSRKRLPQVDGRLTLDGLQEKVMIRRDKWGIPHIHAAKRQDLFFAQGFVHAQDRLWQMDLNRRAATGHLAAVVGEAALGTDRLVRTLGFCRLAAAAWEITSDQVRADVEAYSGGVNAYMSLSEPLPLEFTLLGYRPEPWQPLDTVAFGRLQSWALSHGWGSELARAQLVEKLGPALAAKLEPHYSERQPVTLADGIEFNQLTTGGLLPAAAISPFLGKGMLEGSGRGSNGWVIAASKSASGHAILCNDMHLPVSTPSLWYYLHLFCDGSPAASGPRGAADFHVTGVSLPGAPYVLVGHNEHIAWGATLSFIDCEDLFIEKLDSGGGAPRYEFRGEWRPVEIVEERIQIKGRPDHLEKVLLTHHGPIVSQVLPGGDRVLSMSSMALQPYETFDGFGLLDEARNWEDFVAAIRRIESPSVNLIYADKDDNIGYYVSGRTPIRAQGQGLVPAPGWSGDYEWVGEVPFEEMPHCFNPERGYLISANHRIVDENYPHYLGSLWRNGYRAQRLEQLLAAREKISPGDCRDFQFDLYSIPGQEIVAQLARLAPMSAEAKLSLGLLRDWDGYLRRDSGGGAVYQLFVAKLTENLLEPLLGRDLMHRFLGAGAHPLLHPTSEFYGHWTTTLLRLLQEPDEQFLGKSGDRPALLEDALAQTTVELRRSLGADPRQWQWGRLHQVRFGHALAAQPVLGAVFSQGPYPIGGDTDTVHQTATLPDQRHETNAVAVSYRQIVDMGDLGASIAMFAPGQSGRLGSPNYGDMIEPWLTGAYFQMLWDEKAVAAAARHTLALAPS